MKTFYCWTVLSLFSFSLLAQSGFKGKLKNKDGEPIAQAFISVVLNGETIMANYSDFDGNYQFMIEPGNYTLKFESMEFGNEEALITIASGEILQFNHKYSADQEAAGEQLGVAEIIIKSKTKMTAADANKDIQQAIEQKVIVTSEDIEKKQVPDAQAVATKAVGISVVGSSNLFVRGMGDRYNNATFNGLPIPSPDPDKKVVPLTIFNAGIIRNLSVAKTYNPKYFGDYAGGMIDIATKEYPDNHFLKVSFSTKGNSQTTGNAFQSYSGGSNDYFGFDDGTRDLDPYLVNPDNNGYDSKTDANQSQLFNQNWNPSFDKAPISHGYGLAYGNRIQTIRNDGKFNTFGYMIDVNYSNNYQYQNGVYKVVDAQDQAIINYLFQSSEYSTQVDGLLNLHYDLAEEHNFNFTSFFTNLSSDNARTTSGSHWDYDYDLVSRRYTYKQNQMNINQLRGDHQIKDNIKAYWAGSYSTTKNIEPDRRQLIFGEENGKNFWHALDLNDNNRFWSDLKEIEIAYMGVVEFEFLKKAKKDSVRGKLKVDSLPTLKLTVGGQGKIKEREFEFWTYAYDVKQLAGATVDAGIDIDNPEKMLNNANYNNLYKITDGAGVESRYTVYQAINSGFVEASYHIIPFKLFLNGGVRFENSAQSIRYKKQEDSPYTPIRKDSINVNSLLPTASLKYDLNKRNTLRFAFSQTITRPGFRELAPFQYIEYFAGAKTVGNPNLKNGTNYNYDLKYEFYPTPAESFTLTGFYKNLIDPIEQILMADAGILQTYDNTPRATVAGAEIEFNKNLGFLKKEKQVEDVEEQAKLRRNNFFRNLSTSFNAAYVYSQIDLGNDGSVINTNSKRPLQGASPFLANADLSWERKFGMDTVSGKYKNKAQITLSYNVFGRRLYSAGTLGIGDAYELAVNTLDLSVRLSTGPWDFKAKLGNILNATYQIEQERATDNGEPTLINSYKKGIAFGAGVSYNFDLSPKE